MSSLKIFMTGSVMHQLQPARPHVTRRARVRTIVEAEPLESTGERERQRGQSAPTHAC
jgi:hypothetical protein